MAFKLVQRNTCIVPVQGVISDDNGKPERFEFSLLCRRLSSTEIKAATENLKDRSLSDFLCDVVEGWRNVFDAEGQPVPFHAEAFEHLMDVPGVAVLAVESYFREVGAKAKN